MAIDLRKLFASNLNTDKKFTDALLKAIKNNATKDFDYVKFRQAVVTMKEMDMDAGTAYKSAFATASTMGLTVDKLVKSANMYQRVLDKEKSHFAEAMKNQLAQRVSSKAQTLDKMKSKIEDNKKKMEALQREIEAYENKIASIDEETEKAKINIEETKNKFMEAYEGFTNSISEDVNMIKEYL